MVEHKTDRVEKWQEALSHWDRWNESILKIKKMVKGQYGDINRLLSKAKTEWSLVEGTIKVKRNKQAQILWNLYDVIADQGKEFICNELCLLPISEFYFTLFQHWMKSAIPELVQDLIQDWSFREYMAETDRTYIWTTSRIVDRRADDRRIIDSIHWYRDEIDPIQVAERLPHMKWLPLQKILCKAQGGRPKGDPEKALESIICYALRYRHKVDEGEIAEIFDWKKYVNVYGKYASSTVRKRLALCKQNIERWSIVIHN